MIRTKRACDAILKGSNVFQPIALASRTCYFLSAFILTTSLIAPAPCTAEQTKPSTIKLYGQVDEVQYACRAAGLTVTSTHLPATIERVRLGSPALYAGISDGDKILKARIEDDKLYIEASRNGKLYSAVLHTSPIDLQREKAKEDAEKKELLKAGARKDPLPEIEIVPKDIPVDPEAQLKRLAKYQIVLVVDRSGSRDDPLKTISKSKWQWAQSQIFGLAQKLKPHLAQRGIDLISFNETYNFERHCTPEHVTMFFNETSPRGGTDLGSPLQAVFHEYLETSRVHPLIIAVLTDGLPNKGPNVRDVIIEATRSLDSANQIRLVFLEIGEEFEGWSTIKAWDNNLVADGAKYDIIDSVEFPELAKRGLAEELIEVIKRNDAVDAASHK